MKDQTEKCDADMTVELRDAALEVTDLDRDGFGELTFAYALNCTSDMSPATLKLLTIEKTVSTARAEKYSPMALSRS